MTPVREPLDPAPFLAWLDRRIVRSADADNPQRQALDAIGWAGESGERRLNRWRTEVTQVERAAVEDALHLAGVQLWELYPDTDAKPEGRADRGRSYSVPEDVLIEAHRLHLDGMSLRAVARELYGRTFCATPKSFLNCLSATFRNRGWEVRSRSEATALSNVERAFRPICSHVIGGGHRKGRRCDSRSIGEDGLCWHHKPENIAAGVARLRQEAA